jgi:hypothetical protein
MKEMRSASQIVFGFLPDQTVDLRGGVWRVKEWKNPRRRSEIDIEALRREIVRQAQPWRFSDMDGGFCNQLDAGAAISVVTLDEHNGVEVEPFPKIWICKTCRRISDSPESNCQCGSQLSKGQMQFVGYHDRCGVLKAPSIPKCQVHRQVRVEFPGTSSATEIVFSCPVCSLVLRRGLGFFQCQCGNGPISYNVHRAASVYIARSVVIVNPPNKEKIRAISEAGGPPKALSWLLEGMKSRTLDQALATRESLRRTLLGQGIERSLVEKMVELSGLDAGAEEARISPLIRQETEAQAVSIALAMAESRNTISDLVAGTSVSSEIGIIYRTQYPASMELAGIYSVDLIEKFPVLSGQFGYTRGGDSNTARLMPFRTRKEGYRVYAEISITEAYFIRLDPQKVAKWLKSRGHSIGTWSSEQTARVAIINLCDDFGDPNRNYSAATLDLLTLIHSFAHRLLRISAVFSGVERNSLSELLMPLHLGFFIYAASKGDFVLGGLQSIFEGELHRLIDSMVTDEHRCALDPGCLDGGGACMACLHIGEPSCRYFNLHLSREVLFGANGYLSQVT